MDEVLDIAEVVRRTGLTSRALRFCESRRLVAPLRTNGGRRRYGRAELERINRIVALKRAGLTLAQIERAMTERQIDLVDLIDEQLAVLEARKQEIERSRALLVRTLIYLEPEQGADTGALCALIRQGVEEQSRAAERLPELFGGLDLGNMKQRWADLAARIEAAMPIDPASAEAWALADEVQPIFEPFFEWWRARGADVRPDSAGMPPKLEGLPGWPRFSAKIWQFMFAVGRHRSERPAQRH